MNEEFIRNELRTVTEDILADYQKGRDIDKINVFDQPDNDVIIELKATQCLTRQDEVQIVNYLTALHIDTGLLINFGGDNLEIKRKYREYKKTR